MAHFIKVKTTDGEPLFINLDRVDILRQRDGDTRITWAGDSYAFVAGTPEEILASVIRDEVRTCSTCRFEDGVDCTADPEGVCLPPTLAMWKAK